MEFGVIAECFMDKRLYLQAKIARGYFTYIFICKNNVLWGESLTRKKQYGVDSEL